MRTLAIGYGPLTVDCGLLTILNLRFQIRVNLRANFLL